MKKSCKFFAFVLGLFSVLVISGGPAMAAESPEQTETSVAKVGDMYYDTLAEAFGKVETQGTVELVADVKLSTKILIPAGKDITLDLGSFTVKSDGGFFGGEPMLFENRGTFTVTGEGKIDALEGSNPYIGIENKLGGQVNIRSGEIIASSCGIRNINGTLNISGGTITNTSTASNGEDCAVYAAAGSVTVISGDAHLNGFSAALRSYGAEVTVSENASLEGQFGVMLFNSPTENSNSAAHSVFKMTGGTVTARYGFALSGNNTQSALCSAEISGGTLKAIDGATAIYWPMEGVLTVGGSAVVEGGTGIEAKMGTINITGGTIVGTGEYLADEPYAGGAQAEGSALLVSSQMYGANAGQYITSPDLTVTITGGALAGTQGNAITVYNTEDTNAQTTSVTVNGGTLSAASGRADVYAVNASGESDVTLRQENGVNSFETSQSKTSVTVSSAVAAAAVDQTGNTSYYTDVNAALAANSESAESPVDIYVLKDSEISGETLESEQIKLTTAAGVQLHVSSNVSGMIVKETTNQDGSKTYELVKASELEAPAATLQADKETAHTGETITLTVSSDMKDGVTYTYAWYKDGQLIEGQSADTLTVTESGAYMAGVTAHKTDGSVVLTSEEGRSSEIICTITPHQYDGNWKYNADGHWQECVCGARGNEGEHTFVWKTDKEATASEAGSRHEECTVCGYAKAAVEIPATGTSSEPTEPSQPAETPSASGDGQTGNTNPPSQPSQPAQNPPASGNSQASGTASTATSTATGDSSNIGLWVSLVLAVGVVLAGASIYNMKRKRSE